MVELHMTKIHKQQCRYLAHFHKKKNNRKIYKNMFDK